MDLDRRSNNFATEAVCSLIQWMHRGEFLQKVTRKQRLYLCFGRESLRYLRFLLLNSSPLAQLSRKRDFLQKTTKETKICSFVCQRASLPSVNSNYCELLRRCRVLTVCLRQAE